MLAIIIILSVSQLATGFLLFRTIKERSVYFRSYKTLASQLPALQAEAANIKKRVKQNDWLFWALAGVAFVLWVVGYRLASENDRLKKSA